MNEKVYMHGLGKNYSDLDGQINLLFEILETGALLSLSNQHINIPSGYNGVDYISLCDYERREMYNEFKVYNSYNLFIKKSIALCFPKESLDVIVPTYLNRKDIRYKKNLYELLEDKNNQYSDLLDEVQVKDRIDLSLMSHITFPIEHYIETYKYSKNYMYVILMGKINEIKSMMNYYNTNVDIFDIESKELVNQKLIMKYVYKR